MPSEMRRLSISVPRPLWIFLGTMVLVVVAVGLLIGITISRQQAAIETLTRIGGRYRLRHERPGWLPVRIGSKEMELFDTVELVNLYDTPAGDSEMGFFFSFFDPEKLILHGTAVTDAGLARLGGSQRLKYLDLEATRATDAGLVYVERLTHLGGLDLSRTAVTDAGLRRLTGLKSLKTLRLYGTSVSDVGVAELQRARPGLEIYR